MPVNIRLEQKGFVFNTWMKVEKFFFFTFTMKGGALGQASIVGGKESLIWKGIKQAFRKL